MASPESPQEGRLVVLYANIPYEDNEALKAKAGSLHVDKQTLVQTILQAWLRHWFSKPVGLGEIDRTIVP